jgi:hypothetical protein
MCFINCLVKYSTFQELVCFFYKKNHKIEHNFTFCYCYCYCYCLLLFFLLTKIHLFAVQIRKETKVPGYILPPMTVRVDENQMVKALLDPLHFYILSTFHFNLDFLFLFLFFRMLIHFFFSWF